MRKNTLHTKLKYLLIFIYLLSFSSCLKDPDNLENTNESNTTQPIIKSDDKFDNIIKINDKEYKIVKLEWDYMQLKPHAEPNKKTIFPYMMEASIQETIEYDFYSIKLYLDQENTTATIALSANLFGKGIALNTLGKRFVLNDKGQFSNVPVSNLIEYYWAISSYNANAKRGFGAQGIDLYTNRGSLHISSKRFFTNGHMTVIKNGDNQPEFLIKINNFKEKATIINYDSKGKEVKNLILIDCKMSGKRNKNILKNYRND